MKLSYHFIAVPLTILLVCLLVFYSPFLLPDSDSSYSELIVSQESIIERQESAFYLGVEENNYLKDQIEYYQNQVSFLNEKIKFIRTEERVFEIKPVAPEDRLSESDIYVRRIMVEIRSKNAKK